MLTIINETLVERDSTPYAFDIRVHQLGSDHVEALVQPRFAYYEADMASERCQNALMARDNHWSKGGWVPKPPPTQQELLDRAACNRMRSTRRARTKVRRLSKYKLLTTLLTLTYRENMLDRARMARDFDVFMKRMRRVIPDFEYICVFEKQKRGAWHAHLAVRKVQSHYMQKNVLVRSYDLIRSMWRGVVGADNGNIDVSRNKRLSRSSSKLASYLSKYIGKTFDQAEKYVNSYSASGRDLPPAVLERAITPSLTDAINSLLDMLSPELGRLELYQALMDGGGYYVCLSPHDPGRPKNEA
jgi:hypothetical protein